MVEGECHDCGDEYKSLRQHWAMSDCEEDPSKSSKVEIECANCGESHTEWRYRVEKNGGSFCSHECRDEGRRNGEMRECDWCRELTYVNNCHLDNDHHFCDRDCSSSWRSEAFSGEGHPQWNGGEIVLECEVCGDNFSVTPAIEDEARFCSRDCQTTAFTKNGEYSEQSVETECDYCGEHFKRSKRSLRKAERNFCSDDCFSAWMSEWQRGTDNPAWKGGKGGVTAVRRMIGDRSWNQHAKQTRKNAGHICEMCNKFQPHRKLAAHHIIPVASGGVNEQWNLMALCETCHKKAETFINQYTEPHLLKYAPD